MDSFGVYLWDRDITHPVIVSYYGQIYSDYLAQFLEAGHFQPIHDRENRELRTPDVASELIPKMLRPCNCGGTFSLEWSQVCRQCVTQPVFDEIGTSIQAGLPKLDDIWVVDVIAQLKGFAKNWGIDLDA